MPTSQNERGSALITVLWCMAILGVVAFSMLHTSRLNLRIARNQGDAIQARYLALAGIEKAKALIYQQGQDLQENGTAYSSNLLDFPDGFRDVELGRGLYRIVREPGAEERIRRPVFGVFNTDGFLNVNTASIEELKKIPDMTDPIAAAIVDWRDPDSNVSPGGAEAESYNQLRPRYRIRNGPFESPRELLMVQGVTPELLLGEDFNANGLLDAEERDGNRFSPPDNGDTVLDRAWLEYITLESGVRNINARGQERIDIKSASADELASVDGITDEIAQAIVAARGGNGSLASIAGLLDVRRPQPSPQNQQNQQSPQNPQNPQSPQSPQNPTTQNTGNTPAPSNNSTSQGTGEKLISTELLTQIAGDLSAGGGPILFGRVNINSCNRWVLMCLPGVSEELANAIVEQRGQGFFQNVAELLNVQGMTENVFKQLCPRISVRGDTYQIIAEGEIPSTGARRRTMAVVRYDGIEFETLYYREDL